MSDPIHSTGRGGAGNIGHDPRTYADGEIVHEGIAGESNKAEFSTGRGGAGNIVDSPSLKPNQDRPKDQDVIPETALREHQADFHTGRGGEGNVHRDKFGGHSNDQSKETLGDKVKNILHLGHKKEDEKPQPTGPAA